MALKLGVLALLTAAEGKQAQLAAFLKSGRDIVGDEAGTKVWYGFQLDDSTFGIFDAFDDEEARQAHLTGKIPAALSEVAPDLLATAPQISKVDVLTFKHTA
jgi:quinol monooxygenase YgiN